MITADKSKERKTDRILVIQTIDGKKPKSSTGIVDSRLFTGENKLHLILDTRTLLWYFRYEQGGLPPVLKQRFTTFDIALDFITKYLATRNMKIVEVID